MTQPPRLHASESMQSITDALQEHGVVIVEDLLDQDLLTRFNAELDCHLSERAQGAERGFVNAVVADFFGEHTEHLAGLAAKSTVFATEVLTHPIYRGVCDAVLLPNCAAYQLNLGQVLNRGPGGTAQYLHRDEAVWVHVPKPRPTLQLASVVALRDFTAENGATRVIPGSHLWDPQRQPTDAEAIPAVMKAGSGIIYLGSTIHAAGANTTADQWRRGLHISYCVGWLRTEENQVLSIPMEQVRALPRESQNLLGFGVHDAVAQRGGYLGTVDLSDPVELIAAGKL
ncbi:phytanoyl-CoA dioxygenase family protein [Rhodococcus sp. H29-C3]|uniref:phytanoyl-CoA dioxygenase family protein n=1 Tax=Rhodococcus sp. H29-C3 TaxID=3046307 RepID=UPI0024B88170|nr:phytanoyl-CoA dioxygenase family protein [Rhodococcus sp. H29-C3]MDJ0362586.1 phytanoyl-CoA dioxygenase family protein [Rhodococcus sp. H29-C3]